jgi:hypothetical protein
MDRYRRFFLALILGGLVLSISPTRSAVVDGAGQAAISVFASASQSPAGHGAGLTASGPWRDRDVFVPLRRENRSGSRRGPLLPIAVIAAIVGGGLCALHRRSKHVASLLTARALRSRAPPAVAPFLLT